MAGTRRGPDHPTFQGRLGGSPRSKESYRQGINAQPETTPLFSGQAKPSQERLRRILDSKGTGGGARLCQACKSSDAAWRANLCLAVLIAGALLVATKPASIIPIVNRYALAYNETENREQLMSIQHRKTVSLTDRDDRFISDQIATRRIR